jgi:hypothetical protein
VKRLSLGGIDIWRGLNRIAKSRTRLDEVRKKYWQSQSHNFEAICECALIQEDAHGCGKRQIQEHVMSQEEPCDIRSLMQKRLKYKRTKRFGTSSARSRKCEDIKSAVIGAAKGKAHRQQKDVSQCEE